MNCFKCYRIIVKKKQQLYISCQTHSKNRLNSFSVIKKEQKACREYSLFFIAKYLNIGICQVTVVKYLHHFLNSFSISLALSLSQSIIFITKGHLVMMKLRKCYSTADTIRQIHASFQKIFHLLCTHIQCTLQQYFFNTFDVFKRCIVCH